MGRLTKELQEYRDSLKDKPFKERVKAFFDLSSTFDTMVDEKRAIIKGTFSKKEAKEWDNTYKPIVMALEDYIDRIRTLNINRQYFTFYITYLIRQRDTMEEEAKWLNERLKEAEALKDTEAGSKLLEGLSTYSNRKSDYTQIFFSEEIKRYIAPSIADDKIGESTASLRRILSSLKGYIHAIKDFLEAVGEPELIPLEIEKMEKSLFNTYHPLHGFKYRAIHRIPERRGMGVTAEPLSLDSLEPGEREFIELSYPDLEEMEGLTGERNLFAGSYAYYKNK